MPKKEVYHKWLVATQWETACGRKMTNNLGSLRLSWRWTTCQECKRNKKRVQNPFGSR